MSLAALANLLLWTAWVWVHAGTLRKRRDEDAWIWLMAGLALTGIAFVAAIGVVRDLAAG